MSGFVCALNRDRDRYQVPLALHEAGLLEALVTDLYAPDRWRRHLPAALARRHIPGLPSAKVADTPASFAIQAAATAARLPMGSILPFADALIARKAARVATRRRAHLYAYANYLPAEGAIPPDTRRIVFQFHPLPGLVQALLEADAARFPTVSTTVPRNVRKAADLSTSAWQRADAIVCASAMTRASLLHEGCDPARITVIPYGAEPLPIVPTPRAPTDRAEFLFVGQGVQRKGLHHLIAAWQAADLTHARLTLVCYTIDPGIAATVRSPTIRLLGRQDPASLAALYARSDVFAMPSLEEGFGLVYLEALARGCHVLGTANTGLPDLHLPPEAATLTPVGDVDALAAALTRLNDRARDGALDRTAIARAGTAWRWRDFRTAIAAHAAGVLAA